MKQGLAGLMRGCESPPPQLNTMLNKIVSLQYSACFHWHPMWFDPSWTELILLARFWEMLCQIYYHFTCLRNWSCRLCDQWIKTCASFHCGFCKCLRAFCRHAVELLSILLGFSAMKHRTDLFVYQLSGQQGTECTFMNLLPLQVLNVCVYMGLILLSWANLIWSYPHV